VRCRMRRNLAQNLRENLFLQCLQSRFRRLDQTYGPGSLDQDSVVVVTQLRAAFPAAQSFKIGKPEQIIDCDSQPLGQRSGRFDRRDVPASGGGNRKHPLGTVEPVFDR
jgi:hypothetical protein